MELIIIFRIFSNKQKKLFAYNLPCCSHNWAENQSERCLQTEKHLDSSLNNISEQISSTGYKHHNEATFFLHSSEYILWIQITVNLMLVYFH